MIKYSDQEPPIIGVWRKDKMELGGKGHPTRELVPISVVTYAPSTKNQIEQ